MTLLVLMDIQKGLINEHTEHLVDRITDLCEKNKKKHLFDDVVAVKFVNHINGPHVKLLGWTKMVLEEEQHLLPIVEESASKVFVKHTYSAYTDEFAAYVKEKNVDRVILAGIDTDICVLATAIACFDHGIPCRVLEYYSASDGGNKFHKAGIACIKRILGDTAVSSNIF